MAQAAAFRYYPPPGMDNDDIIQIARVALIMAVDNYDPTAGEATFTTYATAAINYTIIRAIRQAHEGSIAVSHDANRLAFLISRYVGRYYNDCGRQPTDSEIQDALGITPAELSRARNIPSTVSYDIEDEDTGYNAGDAASFQAYQDSQPIPLAEAIRDKIEQLPEPCKSVIRLRLLEGYTTADTAEALGLNNQQVAHLQCRGIKRLREAAEGYNISGRPGIADVS